MPILIELFLTFAKIGMFTFGGGYAMISLIENTCVENKKWITHDEIMTVTVIAESTPGPIAINCATYVGYKKGKLSGAIAATLGMVLPSFIIILLLMVVLNHFFQNGYVKAALSGLKPCIIGIILVTGIFMIVRNCGLMPGYSIDVLTTALTGLIALIYFGSRKALKKGLNPIALICLSAIVGVAVYSL